MNGSIRRRGKASWELVIDLGRDANGKRLRRFVSVKGTKAEAQRRLRELLAQHDKGLPLDASKISVVTTWSAGFGTMLYPTPGREPPSDTKA